MTISDARITTLLDTMNTIVFTIAESGIVTYANPYACRLLQKPVEEVVGAHLLDAFLHPKDHAAAAERFRQLFSETTREFSDAISTLRSADGTLYHIKWNHTLLHGDIKEILLTGSDITQFYKSKQQYQNLVEEISDWVWEVTAEGVLSYVSPRSKELLGYTPEEMLGVSPLELMHPQEAERVHLIFEEFKANKAPINKMRHTLIHKEGREVIVETNGRPVFNDAGELTGYRGINRDITDTVRYEQQLQLSQERFSEFVSHTSDLITQVDHEGHITYVNHMAKVIFGLEPDDCIGLSAFDFIHPDDKETTQQDFARWIAEKRTDIEFENRQVSRDNKIHYMLWSIHLHYDDDGLPDHFNSIAHDITKRIEDEQKIRRFNEDLEQRVINRTLELKRAKESLEKAQRIGKIGSWHRDFSTKEIFWSDEAFHIFELTPPKNHLINIDEFLSRIHPDDINRIRMEIGDKIHAGASGYELDYRILLPDGRVKYLHEDAIITSVDSQILSLEGIVQDVTEAHKTREQLERYNEIMDEYVIASQTDARGIITHVSSAFAEISGYTKEEMVGKSHNIVRAPDIPESFFKEMWETIRSGKIWQGEFKNRKKNGEFYWVDATISPLTSDQGKIIGYTAIRQDITDKKRIERLSITDELTGLYNRRRFNQLFYNELQRAKRAKQIFCLFLMDVDHFKRYNDTYGHQAGDDVLHRIGHILRNGFHRSGDMQFRLGGEEFGGIFTAQDPGKILAFMETIRGAVEGEKIEHKNNDASRYVTASFGLIYMDFNQNNTWSMDTDTIYRRADTLLYRAKEAGRNRIAIEAF